MTKKELDSELKQKNEIIKQLKALVDQLEKENKQLKEKTAA